MGFMDKMFNAAVNYGQEMEEEKAKAQAMIDLELANKIGSGGSGGKYAVYLTEMKERLDSMSYSELRELYDRTRSNIVKKAIEQRL